MSGCPFRPAPTAHDETDAGLSRRRLLGGALGAAVAAPVAATMTQSDGAGASSQSAAARHPFHGAHQSGILTPIQRSAAYVALDAVASSVGELRTTFRQMTETIRFLTRGGTPPDTGLIGTSWDNGILGPKVPADGLTMTVSVGASLFDERFGLGAVRPAHLRRMDEFPNDALDRRICDGDVLIQICADNADTVNHALRQILRTTRSTLQVRWRQDGFQSPPRPSGAPRNLLGFKDGTANPSVSDRQLMETLVWTHARGREPDWVEGGSYHVVRKIRMLVEFWDRVSVREQETMFGRSKASGAPLTGTRETDEPDFGSDGNGEVIRFDAHIRLANPRSVDTSREQILRRSFNYDGGTDPNGQLDMGLIFTAFNQDLERQFVAIQKRLIDEPLVDYISPVGGGYFFALPGVRDENDWFGRGMFV